MIETIRRRQSRDFPNSFAVHLHGAGARVQSRTRTSRAWDLGQKLRWIKRFVSSFTFGHGCIENRKRALHVFPVASQDQLPLLSTKFSKWPRQRYAEFLYIAQQFFMLPLEFRPL